MIKILLDKFYEQYKEEEKDKEEKYENEKREREEREFLVKKRENLEKKEEREN